MNFMVRCLLVFCALAETQSSRCCFLRFFEDADPNPFPKGPNPKPESLSSARKDQGSGFRGLGFRV